MEAFIILCKLFLFSLIHFFFLFVLLIFFLKLLVNVLELLVGSGTLIQYLRASASSLIFLGSVGEAWWRIWIDERILEWILPDAASSRSILAVNSTACHANIWNSWASSQLRFCRQVRILSMVLLCIRVSLIRCQRPVLLGTIGAGSRATSACIARWLTAQVVVPVTAAIHILSTHLKFIFFKKTN